MAKKQQPTWVIGIDEAGRGPLAGPVAVGVVLINKAKLQKWGRIKDSKQLSPAKRAEIFAKLKKERADSQLDFAVSLVSAKLIDEQGIVWAIKKAMSRALAKLQTRTKIDLTKAEVLLDGSLVAPINFKNQKTIIKGDEKITIIALASIAAKVTRDNYMIRLAKKYSHYGFDVHKGYGTAAHYRALKKQGLSPLHRRSFLKRLT